MVREASVCKHSQTAVQNFVNVRIPPDKTNQAFAPKEIDKELQSRNESWSLTQRSLYKNIGILQQVLASVS